MALTSALPIGDEIATLPPVNVSDEGVESSSTGQRNVQPLFTVGYGTRTVEELIAALRSNQIEYLIDVRSSPYSKFKPEFSKEPLQIRLEHAGIRYLFMGDTLGGQPKDLACHTDG